MLSEWDLNEMMKRAGIPATARHVLRTIRMRLAMGAAFPSYQAIADDVGISRRSAIKTVGDCVCNGWLAVRKRSIAPGHNDTNVYDLTPHQAAWSVSGNHERGKDGPAQDGQDLDARNALIDGPHAASVEPVDNRGGGEQRSPGLVIDDHQGSEPRSPKERSNEEGNEEGIKKHTSIADAPAVPFAGEPGEPVSVYPEYIERSCRDRGIEDIAGIWRMFESYARETGHHFAGAAWSKPAAERVFRSFERTARSREPAQAMAI
ncbi:hypothetical protein [Burkholderia multivorans]|uniref:hypothetical protein n=1 Tax=Burkholderia multivorans TaxID=87883 RepID=UPI0021C0841F|nr:hypothetical protein [Burkholderia multivorans]